MDISLPPEAIRVLGVLLEKQMATPDYYPLTRNALVAGCNQKSSRDPVMALSDADVAEALKPLREARMAGQIRTAGSRTTKYEHRMTESFELNRRELAVLAVLMLRGPQTVGELRTRTGRLYAFGGLNEVERTLKELEDRADGPWVTQLPRQPGRKEPRFAHLMGGPVEAAAPVASADAPAAPPACRRDDLSDRVFSLEEEVAELREELASLRAELAELRAVWE